MAWDKMIHDEMDWWEVTRSVMGWKNWYTKKDLDWLCAVEHAWGKVMQLPLNYQNTWKGPKSVSGNKHFSNWYQFKVFWINGMCKRQSILNQHLVYPVSIWQWYDIFWRFHKKDEKKFIYMTRKIHHIEKILTSLSSCAPKL